MRKNVVYSMSERYRRDRPAMAPEVRDNPHLGIQFPSVPSVPRWYEVVDDNIVYHAGIPRIPACRMAPHLAAEVQGLRRVHRDRMDVSGCFIGRTLDGDCIYLCEPVGEDADGNAVYAAWGVNFW